MNTLSVYCYKPLSGVALVPWLERDASGKLPALLKGVPNPFATVEWATSVDSAEIALVPNNFKDALTQEQEQELRGYIDEATGAGRKLFIFSLGDFADRVTFDPRVYVFRYSVYGASMTPQDVVMMTMAEDYGMNGITLRDRNEMPTVSFCGQAGYNSLRQWTGYYTKLAFGRLKSLFVPLARARLIGVYWRRRMMDACKTPGLVHTLFITRRSFGAAMRTIELDPAEARKDFIHSIVESDFVLAPKGDGNYSNRFLEALSLGRIPVLLDTDVVLPFEDEIDYDSFVVRVPMARVDETAEVVRAWYDARDDTEWQTAQKRAREVFETRLRFDAFFQYFFRAVLPTLPLDASTHTRSV